MSNDPKKNLSSQFGDIAGPTDSELDDIELEQAEDPYFTPERTEEFRKAYGAIVDPNYGAVQNNRFLARNRSGEAFTELGRGQRTFENENMNLASLSDSMDAMSQTRSEGAQMGVDTSVDMGSSGDAPGSSYALRGTGMAGWDVEAGPRASRFDVFLPRTSMESVERQLGLMYLRMAGPTCNHPRCRAIRAHGVEMLGRAMGDRALMGGEGKELATEEPIPSVRKDVPMPSFSVKPEAVGKEHLVGSYGTGESTDTGDFVIDYKDTSQVAKHEPADKNNPRWKKLTKEWNDLSRKGKTEFMPTFHPEDYLEHHHYPGEEFEPLPWEAR